MEASGVYSPAEMALLKSIPIEFEFYLDNAMKEKVLFNEWRIWVPAEIVQD